MNKPGKKDGKPTPRERRKFTGEFKQEAVRSMFERRAAGVSLNQIAQDLTVRPEQLRQWARQLRERNQGEWPAELSVVETPEQELRRLRREVATLRQEREFAKKIAVYFARESR
jgi:transposase